MNFSKEYYSAWNKNIYFLFSGNFKIERRTPSKNQKVPTAKEDSRFPQPIESTKPAKQT